MISGAARQFKDWSCYYRLFDGKRININGLFKSIFLKSVDTLKDKEYVVVHMDDTVIKKTGRKVFGAKWRRDPLGPPFSTNFIWGQRFVQLSMALPVGESLIGPSKAIPINFIHCPSPEKPGNNADQQQLEHYAEMLKQQKLNKIGADNIISTRQILDDNGHKDSKLVVCVDGSYTNITVLKALPKNTTLIGRIRKDAKFNKPVEHQNSVGRNKIYGEALPTPEQVRKSDLFEWQSVNAFAAGKYHDFDVKVVKDILWKKAGKDHRLCLIVIRPLSYRLTKKSKLLYRQPAYLICTDNNMDIQKALQFYLWRWQIEVNIKEEKSLIGVGKAHVRQKEITANLPAFLTVIYATLLLAHILATKDKDNESMTYLPRPKWYPHKNLQTPTAGDLVNNFKTQLYCRATGLNFNHFVNHNLSSRSTQNGKKHIIYGHFFARA